jgi:hypothetical protein
MIDLKVFTQETKEQENYAYTEQLQGSKYENGLMKKPTDEVEDSTQRCPLICLNFAGVDMKSLQEA